MWLLAVSVGATSFYPSLKPCTLCTLCTTPEDRSPGSEYRVHGVHTPESENKALNKETLEYVVDDELSDLRALNSTVHEIPREFERAHRFRSVVGVLGVLSDNS